VRTEGTERLEAAAPPGGGFLLAPGDPEATATPETLSGEQVAIRDAVRSFVATAVVPQRERVEGGDHALHRELLGLLGREGYVGVEVPERHGGQGLDALTAVVVTDALAGAGSFAITYAAHAGIGTMPLVLFGREDQRRRHLPGIAAGSTVAAYALTEPGSGSDARGMLTRASRLADGGFRLDGSKQFITNAGFADLFTVYARVEGAGIAAFLVERGAPGLAVGREERKMGVRGSSTCPLTLEGVEVPGDALVGEVGRGDRIAFNVLNVGRLKLAANAAGSVRWMLGAAVAYAEGRRAFGRPIADFPLVGAKLAGMAARAYAVESVVHRLGGLVDARRETVAAADDGERLRAALEEYAVECSIAKVLASEERGWVADELVQVHGGYGFVEDFPASAAYRDARVDRIWEGTSEINRLLIAGMLLRRASRGRIDLLGPARHERERLLGGEGAPPPAGGGPLGAEVALVEAARRAALALLDAAASRFGDDPDEGQEAMAAVADAVIAAFAMETCLLRALQRARAGDVDAEAHADLARLAVRERAAALAARAGAIAPSLGGDAGDRRLELGLRRLLDADPVDGVALARRVAARVRAAGGHPV
jgi:alkylation response protein AidB-like acyl-CoA dehydrogenase